MQDECACASTSTMKTKKSKWEYEEVVTCHCITSRLNIASRIESSRQDLIHRVCGIQRLCDGHGVYKPVIKLHLLQVVVLLPEQPNREIERPPLSKAWTKEPPTTHSTTKSTKRPCAVHTSTSYRRNAISSPRTGDFSFKSRTAIQKTPTPPTPCQNNHIIR